MTDLDTLRRWRSGRTARVLVLHGIDGARGVELVQLEAGKQSRAEYDSVSSAALAITAGRIPWKLVGPGMREGASADARRQAAKRGARNSNRARR